MKAKAEVSSVFDSPKLSGIEPECLLAEHAEKLLLSDVEMGKWSDKRFLTMIGLADIRAAANSIVAIDENGTLIRDKASRIVLFYVDALGYERYEQAKSEGIINNITSLGEPEKIMCVYPSISIVNSKTLVSGIPPNASAGNFRYYTPDGPTILEIAGEHDLTAYWIDGKTSPVNLGDYTIYRPNKDDNGYEADEVTAEALQKYGNQANLLFVHFKDTDSVMHAEGPYSSQAMAALQFADEQIGRMLQETDPGTMVIIYADHGGHTTFDGGNHGTLIRKT